MDLFKNDFINNKRNRTLNSISTALNNFIKNKRNQRRSNGGIEGGAMEESMMQGFFFLDKIGLEDGCGGNNESGQLRVKSKERVIRV
jgi:hypothetical protein